MSDRISQLCDAIGVARAEELDPRELVEICATGDHEVELRLANGETFVAPSRRDAHAADLQQYLTAEDVIARLLPGIAWPQIGKTFLRRRIFLADGTPAVQFCEAGR